MIIAFDVDDTLVIPSVAGIAMYDSPNYDVINVFKFFQSQGHQMIIWSGGGIQYAENWANRLGLAPCEIRVKQKSLDVDICFDDCDVDLAKVNIKVKRLNNSIS